MIVNPQIYLPYLQCQLLTLGATFVRRRLTHICEAFALNSPVAVVNATGLHARHFGGIEDHKVFPIRGQTILVRNECAKMYSMGADDRVPQGESTYIIPRACGGGTILGGCRQVDN
jgi:glycine/D-amino acid oxidase-like deaminating enzyme